MVRYFNFDSTNNRYYQVDAPSHDHYDYYYPMDSWFEVPLTNEEPCGFFETIRLLKSSQTDMPL